MDWTRAERFPLLCRRNYYYEFLHTLPWGVVAGVVEGNLAAVVASRTFHAGPVLLWIASATPIAMYITSLVWGALCVGRRKVALMTVCIAGTALFLATVAAVPGGRYGGWYFAAQMAAAQFFVTGVLTVRSALWKSNYTTNVRGQATARFQMVRAVTGTAAVLAAATVFDRWPDAYRWIYPSLSVCCLVAVAFLWKIRVRGEQTELRRIHAGGDGPRPVSPWSAANPILLMRQTVRVFRDDPRFARYCSSLMLVGIGNLLVGTISVVIVVEKMLTDMGHYPSVYAASTILLDVFPRVVMLGVLGRMGRWYDRVGVVQFRVSNGVHWALTNVTGVLGALFVVYGDAIGPYALVGAVVMFAARGVTLGLGYAGGSLAYNLGHLHFADPDRAELYMGIHVTLSGIRGLAMPGLGMLLWAWIGWPVWLVALLFSVLGVVGYVSLAREEARLPRT